VDEFHFCHLSERILHRFLPGDKSYSAIVVVTPRPNKPQFGSLGLPSGNTALQKRLTLLTRIRRNPLKLGRLLFCNSSYHMPGLRGIGNPANAPPMMITPLFRGDFPVNRYCEQYVEGFENGPDTNFVIEFSGEPGQTLGYIPPQSSINAGRD